MRLWRVVAALCLVVAACSGATEEVTSTTSTPPTTPTTVAPPTTTSTPTTATTEPPAPSPEPFPAPPATPGFWSVADTNTVLDMAFASDGSVWAATTGGAVHWDLDSGRYEEFRSEDGLGANLVEGVAVGSDGVVWLATGAGVSSFDGSTWTTRLDDRAVFDVLVAADGTVWLGTSQGITALAGGRITDYTMDDGLPSPTVVSLAETHHGEIYASAAGYDEDPGRPGVIRFADGTWVDVSDPRVTNVELAAAPDGTLWAFDGPSLASFDGSGWELEDLAAPWPDPRGMLLSGTAAMKGELWLGTEAGVERYDGERWESVSFAGDIAEPHVWSITVGVDGNPIAGTYDGIAVHDGAGWTWHRTASPLPSSSVRALELAPDGTLWIGTDRGVTRWDGTAWTTWTDSSIDGGFVESIAVATNGTVWAGNANSISWFDGDRWHAEGGPDGSGPHEGNGMFGAPLAAAPDGSIWAIRRLDVGGPINYRDGDWVSPASDAPPECLASGLAVGQDGTLWVATRGSGLCAYDGTEWQVFTRGLEGNDWDQWGRDDILAVAVAPDGATWVGTNRAGIGRLQSGAWQEYRSGGLTEDAVTSFAFATDGTVWAGTLRSGVLSSSDGRSWARMTAGDGLASNHVSGIAVDEAGAVWIGTDAGLSRYLAADDVWYEPPVPFVSPKPAHGGAGSGCSPGSTRLPDGVWFGLLTSVEDTTVGFDLACWTLFEDGSWSIVNDSPTIRSVPVAPDAAVSGEATAGVSRYDEWRTRDPLDLPRLVWLYVNDGRVTAIAHPLIAG